MERRVTLSKGAYLWDAGDAARSVAVLESGRLGVKTDEGVVAILAPRTVLGESAIFTLAGPAQRRTAAIVALADETIVTEYAAATVRKAFSEGKSLVAPLILTTLVGQICRNSLLILASNRGRAVVEGPVRGLLTNTSQTAKLVKDASSWDDFYFAFRFLSAVRDFTDQLRERFVTEFPDRAETVLKASTAVGGWFAEHGLETYLEELVATARESERWLRVEAG